MSSYKNVDFDHIWPSVLGTIHSVINRSQYGSTDIPTWQTRFFDIYNICSATPDPFSERLYAHTKTALEKHCISMNEEINKSGQNTLSVYFKYWKEYSMGASYLNNLYSFLNNQLVKKRPMVDLENYEMSEFLSELDERFFIEIGELALESWIKLIIEPSKDRLVRLLLEQIRLDRVGEGVNQTTIKGVIMSFIEVCQYRRHNTLRLYEESFENLFLQETGEHYQKEGDRLREKLDCVEYMKKVINLIDDEEFRSRKYLNSTSYPKVYHECLQHLVCNHLTFITDGCDDFILQENLDALRNMYKLLKPTQAGLDYMVKRFQVNMTNIGHERMRCIKGENLPALFTQVLLEIHTKYLNIVRDIFSNHADFISAFDKACASIVNMKYENRSLAKASELLAHYCDSILRKSSKATCESEVEEKLLDAIRIFNYLDDKDYFQRFYQKMLARRLINQQSTSIDAEEFMVTRLKEMCGYEFTNKLARMFQDVKVSEDLCMKFFESLKSQSNSTIKNETMAHLLGLDFSIYILQANSWPVSQSQNNTFSVPPLLEKSIRSFELFYNEQYSGRKLSWLHNLSTVDVRMFYFDRPYFVTMSTYQMATLILFNDHQKLSFKELEESTRLSTKELEKQLSILIENKLLLRDDTEFQPQTIISLNTDFKNKRTKFKISTTTSKEVHHDIETAEQAADEHRKFYLQAIIMANSIGHENAVSPSVVNHHDIKQWQHCSLFNLDLFTDDNSSLNLTKDIDNKIVDGCCCSSSTPNVDDSCQKNHLNHSCSFVVLQKNYTTQLEHVAETLLADGNKTPNNCCYCCNHEASDSKTQSLNRKILLGSTAILDSLLRNNLKSLPASSQPTTTTTTFNHSSKTNMKSTGNQRRWHSERGSRHPNVRANLPLTPAQRQVLERYMNYPLIKPPTNIRSTRRLHHHQPLTGKASDATGTALSALAEQPMTMSTTVNNLRKNSAPPSHTRPLSSTSSSASAISHHSALNRRFLPDTIKSREVSDEDEIDNDDDNDGDDDDDDSISSELDQTSDEETSDINPTTMISNHPVTTSETLSECAICCEMKRLQKRSCCNFNVCSTCLNIYVEQQVKQGIVRIQCPNQQCHTYMHRDEINKRCISPELRQKLTKFLVDANRSINVKTCPRCSNVHEIDLEVYRSMRRAPTKVQCVECNLIWCFQCHSPWHDGIQCKEFRRGDRMLKKWAREVHYGQHNAQQCPSCK
ncbi:unnamed protein product, partial [Adineta ricciae]